MENLQLISAIIGVGAYVPLFISVVRGKIKLNFATWALFVMLDIITIVALYLQNGNYKIIVAFMIGASSVSIALAFKRQIRWTRFDTFISFLILSCLIIWHYTTNDVAIIASVAAQFLASVPQAVETAKRPEPKAVVAFILFGVANVVSLIGGTAWTIEQRLFPTVFLIVSIIMIWLTLRKAKIKTKTGS